MSSWLSGTLGWFLVRQNQFVGLVVKEDIVDLTNGDDDTPVCGLQTEVTSS